MENNFKSTAGSSFLVSRSDERTNKSTVHVTVAEVYGIHLWTLTEALEMVRTLPVAGWSVTEETSFWQFKAEVEAKASNFTLHFQPL